MAGGQTDLMVRPTPVPSFLSKERCQENCSSTHPARRMLVSHHIVASGGPGGFGGLQRYPSTPLLRRWTYEDTTFIAVQYKRKYRVVLSCLQDMRWARASAVL